tara:strand:+ start:10688 stop:10792 length:105 start_codon:yes stop_codon:yes gene_type:complete
MNTFNKKEIEKKIVTAKKYLEGKTLLILQQKTLK